VRWPTRPSPRPPNAADSGGRLSRHARPAGPRLGRYDSAFERLSEIQDHPPSRSCRWPINSRLPSAPGARIDRYGVRPVSAVGRARESTVGPRVVERCRALICAPSEVEQHYARAVGLHAEGGRPFQRARTHLLYGEWLRRSRRPTDARTQLRAALETFERLEATPWADRTRNELRAAGEIAARRTRADPFRRLTPQELQVIRLAATGATNREIAGQLFLSPRTVGYPLQALPQARCVLSPGISRSRSSTVIARHPHVPVTGASGLCLCLRILVHVGAPGEGKRPF
jgi:hypothetical protein